MKRLELIIQFLILQNSKRTEREEIGKKIAFFTRGDA